MKHAVFLFVFSMAMLSACRTTREMSYEERSVHTSETSLTSTDSSFSFERFLSALSMDADSIVVWFGDAHDESFAILPKTATSMVYDSCCTAVPLRTSAPSPLIGKVKMAGVHIDSQKSVERAATRQSSDSVRSHSSADEQFSEQLVKSPRTPSLLELLAAVGIAALIAGAYIIYERLAHR